MKTPKSKQFLFTPNCIAIGWTLRPAAGIFFIFLYLCVWLYDYYVWIQTATRTRESRKKFGLVPKCLYFQKEKQIEFRDFLAREIPIKNQKNVFINPNKRLGTWYIYWKIHIRFLYSFFSISKYKWSLFSVKNFLSNFTII